MLSRRTPSRPPGHVKPLLQLTRREVFILAEKLATGDPNQPQRHSKLCLLRKMRVRPRSTQYKPGIRRTPRRHPATRNDGLPQGSTRTRQTRNRKPGELPAGIPTPRNDGPPTKLDADTTQCSARRQRTPRQHTGLAEQRDSPRRSRRTHFTVSEFCDNSPGSTPIPQLPEMWSLESISISQLDKLTRHNRATLRNSCL